MTTNAATHPLIRRRANAARKALQRGRASQILRTGRTLEAACQRVQQMGRSAAARRPS